MTLYTPVQQLSPFISRQLYRDRIAVFTITNLGRAAMDQWFEMTNAWYTEAENRPHPGDRVVLALQDFSHIDAGVTPYGRFKAQELVRNHPDLKGRSAIIVSHVIYAKLTTELLIRSLEGKVERSVFHDKGLGLQWLEEELPQLSTVQARVGSTT